MTKTYEEKKEKAQYCSVVNGNLNNIYTENDAPLKSGFTQIYKGKKCIGLYPIFERKDFKEKDLET